MDHDDYVDDIVNYFKRKGYETKIEVPLKNGTGSVDILAYNEKEKIYCEVKSSPSSLKQKKVKKQLEKYVKEFGKKHKYALISPDSKYQIKIDWFNQ